MFVCRRIILLSVALPGLWGQTPAAEPQEWRERWDSYVERTYSWQRIGIVGVESAFDQLFQSGRCPKSPSCLPDHFGGALVRRTTRTTMELGAGALLREDIRRTPSGLTGFRK